MKAVYSLISAFQMYSRIPMPQIEWKAENRRCALCFFPLVGAAVGAAFALWRYICGLLGVSALLFAAGSVFIPIAVTGGIHLDGFCDTADAYNSFGPPEKKLKIMSDPHIGSFAVIYLFIYLLMQTALFAELYTLEKNIRCTALAAVSFVLSRELSAIAAVKFKPAKNEGMLYELVSISSKSTLRVLSAAAALTIAVMLIVRPVSGAAAAVGAGICLACYKNSAYKNLGGITGDTAGRFLQLCELAQLFCIVAAEKISEAVL